MNNRKMRLLAAALAAAMLLGGVTVFADGEQASGEQPIQEQILTGSPRAGGTWDESGTVYTDEQGVQYTVSGGTATVTDYDDSATEVKIPETIQGEDGTEYKVTSIGEEAFWSCDNLKSVTIPDGVTSIGDWAFRLCESLESVDIPDGVTSIGDYAFTSCTSLKSVTIPDSVISIGGYAFSGCESLESINIPNGVTSISASAFSSCTSLESINIPNGVTSIGNSAFTACTSLKSINIPNGVTSIGDAAFSGCGLTNVTIPDSVETISRSAFNSCKSLKSITIPDSVTSIGDMAFAHCSGLEIESGQEIGLESVTFESTTPPEFGSNAFWLCEKLETIYLSNDLTEEQRTAWEKALKDAGLTVPIEYKDLSPEPETPTQPTTPPTPSADTAAEQPATPTVQQMETAERPDPQDVEATERYNFWMGVKSDLRAAADGKTLRVHVPADYTNMPASVMEQIRLLEKDITVDLRWNGERLTITPATAQRKTALKAFWTFEQLCELYAQ